MIPLLVETNRDRWARILRATVQGLTSEQEKLAIDRLVLTDLDGEPCGTWHAAALVTGTVCNCVPCRTKKEETYHG